MLVIRVAGVGEPASTQSMERAARIVSSRGRALGLVFSLGPWTGRRIPNSILAISPGHGVGKHSLTAIPPAQGVMRI